MKPSFLLRSICVVGLTLCSGCKQGPTSSVKQQQTAVARQGQAANAATATAPQAQTASTETQTAPGSVITGVIVSSEPGGGVNATMNASGTGQQQSLAQPLTARTQAKLPVPEGPPPTLKDVEKRLGPFTLAPGQDFFVVIHSKRIEGPGTADEAATWLEIRDATGAVQHHEDYAYTVSGSGFNDQCSAGAQMLSGTNGKGIMIDSECLPSAPLSGGPMQIFALVKGKLTAINKPLYVQGDMEEFVPGAITKRGQLTIFSPDMLKFKVFTGNVFVIVPVRVNWMEGRLEMGIRCYEQSGHGMVESGCELPVVDAQPASTGQEMTFVRMFPESNEQMMPAHVVIQPRSKVEILAAKVRASFGEDKDTLGLGVDEDVWLKIRVDGKEGWIHTQEDFEAVGLPQSG